MNTQGIFMDLSKACDSVANYILIKNSFSKHIYFKWFKLFIENICQFVDLSKIQHNKPRTF